ncbi:DUF3617 family protein [Sphingomonas sp. TF3]|uniref:DUF3617 domain-containing protein n=1 Tax=Sphingomonas sp. TF3 TaxID=2495580 RepID=UPI000F874115|nr:DUF3617 family protein [Sphingomonas sp. TF3]RUN75592.1 DUF3617 family protein [Sphingomonas sp. TF3]
MTFRIMALLALPLAASACSPDAPVKRQAGSWSQKIDIVKFEGKGATPETKTQMQKMFDAMSTMSVCLTPAAAAKEDMGKAMEQMSARGQNCTFAKKDVTGASIAIDATCKQPNGGTVKMTMTGTNSATAQDMTMKTEGFAANGTQEGTMEMHVKSTRNGECKPTDVTPPEAPATGPAPVGPAKP